MTSEHRVDADLLKEIREALNRYDLDAIMEFFADDAVLCLPRGSQPGGVTDVGKQWVRDGLATRVAGLPDVHYDDDLHGVCGDRGVSAGLLTGTTPSGMRVAVRGCDLW